MTETALDSILVPVDGSSFAEQALLVAAAVGRPAHAKLRLALVHRLPPAPRTAEATQLYTRIELATREAAHRYLDGLAARLKQQGYSPVEPVVLCGSPGPTLTEYAEQCDASLIVMSTHGRGGVQRAWLGSVADHLVRHASVPVLLMRPGEGASQPVTEYQSILVPLDGSPLAEAALPPAKRLAQGLGAAVHLVQVVRPFAVDTGFALSYPTGSDDRLVELCRAEAQDYLQDIAERLRNEGVRATSNVVIAGSVPETILAMARTEPAGIIALATHGHGGLRRFTFGSVADKVMRSADRPVLVCPVRAR